MIGEKRRYNSPKTFMRRVRYSVATNLDGCIARQGQRKRQVSAKRYTSTSRLLSGLLGIVIGCLLIRQNGLTSPPAIPALFDFHSGFWLNLDLALYQRAQAGADRVGTADNDPGWKQALAYYRANIVSRDLLFDNAMVTVKNSLEDQEHAPTLQPTEYLTPAMVERLQGAARCYRNSLWSKQDDTNKRWIEQMGPLVDRYGLQLAKRLSAAYRTPWPRDSIRVDVSNYASWAGAYTTTNGPTIAPT